MKIVIELKCPDNDVCEAIAKYLSWKYESQIKRVRVVPDSEIITAEELEAKLKEAFEGERKYFVVVLNYTTGCEADATSTIVKAVFTRKQDADDYIKSETPKINWNNYYMGDLDIEEIPVSPSNSPEYKDNVEHICKYCGAKTTQSDDVCWNNPHHSGINSQPQGEK